MRKYWLATAAIALSMLVVVYVGCGTKGVVGPPPPPPPTQHPSPVSASTTVALALSTALPIPAFGGFSGTFVEPVGSSPPAGSTVTLTSYDKTPAGAPAPQAAARLGLHISMKSPALSPTLSTIFWVSQQYSAAVNFAGFPATTWQVPSSFAGTPLALETFDGTEGTLLDTEFDTSENGSVTFAGSSTSNSVVNGHTYWWELISGKPIPSPSPSTSPSPSPAPLLIVAGAPDKGSAGLSYGTGHGYCTCFCKRAGCRHSWTGFAVGTTGGTPPLTWSWSPVGGSFSVPPGLSIGPAPFPANAVVGDISGTPTVAGTYRVIVKVTDSGSPAQRAQATYSIVIYPSPSPLAATEYAIPTANSGVLDITSGPDGNLWFTENSAGKVGKVTTSGTFSEFPISPQPAGVIDIHTGPDGNLWFSTGSTLDQINPTSGAIASFFGSPHSFNGLISGPGGNLWVTDTMSTSFVDVIFVTGALVHQYPVAATDVGLGHIAVGSDGNLWFAETIANAIGKITPSGTVSQFPLPTAGSGLSTILNLGPDGNIWFAESGANQMGKITPSGVITEYPIPYTIGGPEGEFAGPDGNVWFTDPCCVIGRITPTGTVSLFESPTLSRGSGPNGITLGPDGDLWFTENGTNDIAKFKP